jgi:hypothetical protein
MQGIKDETAEAPDPLEGKKKCNKCGKWKRVNYLEPQNSDFYTAVETRKWGHRRRYWRSRCIKCTNQDRLKWNVNPTWDNREVAAKRRALTKLVKMVPHLFLPLLVDELRTEYETRGLSTNHVEHLVKKRTRYVRVYIKKAEL